jgi:hypothetical protein
MAQPNEPSKTSNVIELPTTLAWAHPKKITHLRQDPATGGYYVTFSCGHTVWWAVDPGLAARICGACLDAGIRGLKRRPE